MKYYDAIACTAHKANATMAKTGTARVGAPLSDRVLGAALLGPTAVAVVVAAAVVEALPGVPVFAVV